MFSVSIVPGAERDGQLDDLRCIHFFRTWTGLRMGAARGVAVAVAVEVGVALGVAVGIEVGVALGVGVDAEGAALELAVSLGEAEGALGGGGLAASRFAGIDAAVSTAPTKSNAIDRAFAADTAASRPDACSASMAFIL
jgi:hypothetical protein